GYKPSRAKSLTPRFLIIINGLLLVLCYDAGALRGGRYGYAFWLGVAALLAGNAVWHIIGTVKTRSYSPGVVTGTLLYIPMALMGMRQALGLPKAEIGAAVIAVLIGLSYHWGSAGFDNRRGEKAG